MNLEQLNQKLLAAARRQAPDERVPYAFEKRIMARLAAAPVPDGLVLWAQALWRAAIPCVAVVLLLGLGAFFLPADISPAAGPGVTAAAPATELSQDLENTLLAAVDQPAGTTEDAR